jgi:hypothetical protein
MSVAGSSSFTRGKKRGEHIAKDGGENLLKMLRERNTVSNIFVAH